MNKLYIKSIENRLYHAKHECIIREIVDGNKLLVEFAPPIPGFAYNQIEDIHRLVLAPRYVGMALTPTISELPCNVNMCLPKKEGNWTTGPWRLLDIGELFTGHAE